MANNRPNIGKYFIMAVFSPNFAYRGNEHFVEEWMPNELFDILEAAAQEKYNNASLHQLHAEWDLDRFFITIGGEIGTGDEFVVFNFHVGDNGKLRNITVNRG